MRDGSVTKNVLDEEAIAYTEEITRKIKFEAELDLDFGEKIAAKAYGQKLLSCIQCGTCSATCPMSHYMDYTPRRVIAMTREGFKNEVLHSATIWLCASCYSCTVQCPRNIHITDVMYALKREAMAEGVYPKRYPIPVLARNFHNLVMTHGRNSEGWLILRLFMQTNPFKLINLMKVGLRLMLTGRFSMKFDRIKNIKQLQVLLNAMRGTEKGVQQQ